MLLYPVFRILDFAHVARELVLLLEFDDFAIFIIGFVKALGCQHSGTGDSRDLRLKQMLFLSDEWWVGLGINL